MDWLLWLITWWVALMGFYWQARCSDAVVHVLMVLPPFMLGILMVMLVS